MSVLNSNTNKNEIYKLQFYLVKMSLLLVTITFELSIIYLYIVRIEFEIY